MSIRFPGDLRRNKKRVQQLYRELEGKLGRSVNDEEMAGALGMNLPQWHRALNTIENVGTDCTGRRLTAGPNSKFVSQQTEPELLVDKAADPFDLCYFLPVRPRTADYYPVLSACAHDETDR